MKSHPDSNAVYAQGPVLGEGADEGFGDAGGESTDIVAALWRYRWAVVIPAVIGGLIGFLVYLRTPEMFKASTKLMVESDQPALLDSATGNVLSGVPTIDVLRSQLFSDRVVSMAFQDPRLLPFHDMFAGDPRKFISTARQSLDLTTDEQGRGSPQVLIAQLSFEHESPELCEASVKAFSDSLQKYFNERHQSSRGELMRLINVAMDELHPKLAELEEEYSAFREQTPLAWDSEGNAINPHRQRQLYLVERRSELYEQLRKKSVQVAAVERIAEQSDDPAVALDVISQLLAVPLEVPGGGDLQRNLRETDTKLAQLELDEKLVPLMIERNKYANEYGENHPTVKQLDTELETMKRELRRLVREQSERMIELVEQGDQDAVAKARAKEAVESVLMAAKAEKDLLDEQIAELDQQIEQEKKEAFKLAKYEQQDTAMMREMDRHRELIDQLEQQMARVSVSEEDAHMQVEELTAPSNAYRVWPILWLLLGAGSFVGLALGGGLAFLLEKNANTFRTPEEITETVGAPILTHVPFFRGRIRRSRAGEENPYEGLDPCLVVLHSPASVVAEAIRSMRTSIFFDLSTSGGNVIQMTSPLPGDGKTTVAGNLACAIAQSGKRILAIDGDLRRPQLTDSFNLADEFGLTNVLNGECDPSDACHATPVDQLDVMPSGPIPGNPAEALTLPEMGELLDVVREKYDYVIVDTPPLLVVTDPSILASMVDGVVMALRIRRKSKLNAREAAGILRGVHANLLGTIVNNSDESTTSDGYRGYGYYRYSRYARKYYRRSEDASASSDNSTLNARRSGVLVSGRRGAPLKQAQEIEPQIVSNHAPSDFEPNGEARS